MGRCSATRHGCKVPARCSGHPPSRIPASIVLNERMGKRLFGRYRLHERLGVGGWAEVWRATDEQTGETVALKRLHPHVSRDSSARSRLRREAAAVSVIKGPGVVRVRDLVEDGDEVALVLDFVEGEPLSEILARDGSLPRRQALDIVGQVAEALAAAHAAGIVHRDVKPSNIIVDPAGEAHLIDFGIAQTAEVSSQLTGAGSVVGTLRYLAPEVLRGEPATPASDVWALAALAYLLIEGQPPFNGVVPSELVAEEASPPPAPTHAEPDLAALLMAGLSREPGARPHDAGEFAAHLRSIAADSPTLVISVADPTVTLAAATPALPGEAAPSPALLRGDGMAPEPPAAVGAAPARTTEAPAPRRSRQPATAPLAAAVLVVILGVAGVTAALGGFGDLGADPGGAAAADLVSPTPTTVPTPSPVVEAGNEGAGGGDNGKGGDKGKGGDNGKGHDDDDDRGKGND